MSRTVCRYPPPAGATAPPIRRRQLLATAAAALAAALLLTGPGRGLEAQELPKPKPAAKAGRGPVSPFASAARLAVPDHAGGAAGQLVHVAATSPAKVFVWLAGSEGLEVFAPAAGAAQNQCAVKAAAAGTYRLWCIAVLGDRTATGLVTITITGAAPTPTPPTPTPTPPADVGKLWAVVIETPEGAPNRGQLFADPALTAYAKIKGHRFRIVDKNVTDAAGNTPADVAPYIQLAGAEALPQLFLVTERGAVLYRGALPDTADALLALIKKVGG